MQVGMYGRAMRVRVPRSMFALYDVVVARRRLLPPLLNRKSTERRPRPNERPPCPAPPLPPPPTYFGRDLGDWARPSLFLLVFPLLRRPLLPAPARCLLFLGGVWRDESPLSHSPSASVPLDKEVRWRPLDRGLGRPRDSLPQLCLWRADATSLARSPIREQCLTTRRSRFHPFGFIV